MSKQSASHWLHFYTNILANLPAHADAKGVGFYRRKITECKNILSK